MTSFARLWLYHAALLVILHMHQKNVVKLKVHILRTLFNNIFSEHLVVCEIIRTNIVVTDRPKITTTRRMGFQCCLHKATDTH
jgi:hypothetical protein